MKAENDRSNRGDVLLAELKALLDSFPRQLRIDVVETLKIVFRGLDADSKTLRSVQMQPEAHTILSSSFRQAQESAELNKEPHRENQTPKKEGKR